ncbi:MAG: 4Fe-4S dicluster domain-containing protein [Gammaproteobacteria bacterium]|nr:4Fe-4S dicluster domain-containing protein [Gammaproteobacteria bacterium]
MTTKLAIAIVGSGPGGLSAAARAAEVGVSHVLLEQTAAHSNTIQKYQKGKHVMAEPNILPLRSPMRFEAGTREKILGEWAEGLVEHKVDIRYGAEVVGISGAKGDFHLKLQDGSEVLAENVILGIGLQGNPRRLGVPGDGLPCVQYTLDDPDEYKDEVIVVVGAGDAAIENAVALARQNTVYLVNRSSEFSRCKDGNLALILKTIEAGKVTCLYSTQCASLTETPAGERPYLLALNTSTGEIQLPCNRIIARLGATPPRKFVESCGIKFPSNDPSSLPVLSTSYESNVPGLYVIGALGGYPLIKQAMNQGYEVVEFIRGNPVAPADEPLLATKFAGIPGHRTVSETLQAMQQRIPLFTEVNPLIFRELILGSTIHVLKPGEVVFKRNDYTNSFYTIFNGGVDIQIDDNDPAKRISLALGQFFGEMGLLSGRRRTATVLAGKDCVLIETPRRDVLKLLSSVDAARAVIDQTFILRAIQSGFAPQAKTAELLPIAAKSKLNRYKAGQVVFSEGDEADALHLVRSGSLAVLRSVGGREIVTSYVAAGNYVGEMGLMGNTRRSATVRATVVTETISLDANTFAELLQKNSALRAELEATVRQRVASNTRLQGQDNAGELISFLLKQGLGEATDVLLIDETLCVGCDNCERACAATHGGTSRLDRAAGPTYANVHVPTSCRHCEDPHCMKDCPPDAIRRSPNGEVFVGDNCIGCGNCERNCPYGVIQLAGPPPEQPSLASWLMFGSKKENVFGEVQGLGRKHHHHHHDHGAPKAVKKAVKCDMCKGQDGGPACVRACPTGAALRVSPEEFVAFVQQEASRF